MRPFVLAVCWYVVPGIIWVLASDSVVALFVSNPAVLGQISAAKGIVFVVVSGLIISRLLARQYAARQVVEAAYTETERGFRPLFKNNPLPVWAYDRETLRFLEINDVALAKYGYERDELLAMQVTELHPADEVPQLRRAIATPREVREISGAWHHRLKDGSLIDVEVQVHDLETAPPPAESWWRSTSPSANGRFGPSSAMPRGLTRSPKPPSRSTRPETWRRSSGSSRRRRRESSACAWRRPSTWPTAPTASAPGSPQRPTSPSPGATPPLSQIISDLEARVRAENRPVRQTGAELQATRAALVSPADGERLDASPRLARGAAGQP